MPFRISSPSKASPVTSRTTSVVAHPVVKDITLCTCSPSFPSCACELDLHVWHRIPKDLYLHSSPQNAWLYVALATQDELTTEDSVVVDIQVGKLPLQAESDLLWESRPGGIFVLKSQFSGNIDRAVTEVDVLFGVDAIDPRPQWTLALSPLQLPSQSDIPVARLSVLHGRADPRPDTRAPLRVRENGSFKIVQISDTHMVNGVGTCNDAIDASGKHLPQIEADPLTVELVNKVLDIEKPDLVIFTGDQLHHDVPDSQTAIYKVLAPVIERSTPFAVVFGNHDSEGTYAMSRTEQMSMIQRLPHSYCEPGPEHVDGTGNFYVHILAPAPSQLSLSTLYFLDSHGQVPSWTHRSDYEPITQSQIDWFVNASHEQKTAREGNITDHHLSLAFLHIPLPEFGDRRLRIRNGHRREPTEGPSVNTHFYNALVSEGVSAVGCGHDHVNDFCGLLPQQTRQGGYAISKLGPWLCYGGSSGFGGYGSYGRQRYHRRMRVWELDTRNGSLKTWKRVEFAEDRVDEIVLVENGAVIDTSETESRSRDCVVSGACHAWADRDV